MGPPTIAPYKSTPIESIAGTAALVRNTFTSQKTKPLEYRIAQLRKLYWAIHDATDEIIEACTRDLGKPVFETHMAEIDWCKNDIVFTTKNLAKWAADESPPDIALSNKLMSPKIRKEPLGHVLVLGCWNFPIQLSLGPFIGAIAAGCTAVLKPSEVSPNSAMVLQKIIESSLDPEAYAVVNGAIPETNALLAEKWDKIFYTGNAQVGTIIAKKAAETLTPVTLELGGRNPAIVSAHADPRLVARRLLWGKLFNAGQVCISQNYILVDESILPALVAELKVAIKEFYPNGTKASSDYARIVNDRHFARIKAMLDNTEGKILIGGDSDESQRWIDITVVQVKSTSDSMVRDESFGPLIPILPVPDLTTAIRLANEVHRTPLGLYAFGTKAETNRILSEVTSGGASVNDAFFHGSVPTLPFGGVGDSGTGAYRGRTSFECFSHRRSVTTTPSWLESMLAIRYPPYSMKKLGQMRASSALKPNFDRDGNLLKSGVAYWIKLIVGLGAVGYGALGAKKWAERRGGVPGYLK